MRDMASHNIRAVYIFLGDEFGSELNSRNFKTNLDALSLNTILTCRHYNMSLFYTAQRFNHVDALLRQVTSYVVDCTKYGRILKHISYNAYDLDNAQNTQLLKPCYKGGFIIKDSDYNAYNTLSCVKHLIKDVKNNDMLSAADILSKNISTPAGVDSVLNTSKKYKKYRKNFK